MCSAGRYNSVTGAMECAGECPRGKYGTLQGKANENDAYETVPLGFYASITGAAVVLKCPGEINRDSNGNSLYCYGHGVCNGATGRCECTKGTGWRADSDCRECSPEWNNNDGRCSSCKASHDPWPPSAPEECLEACTEGNVREETGLCGKPLWESILKVVAIISGIVSGLVLVYKIGIFVKLRKNGMLKPEYTRGCMNSASGFLKVLAYGTRGDHVINNVDKMKEIEMQSTTDGSRSGGGNRSTDTTSPTSKATLQTEEEADATEGDFTSVESWLESLEVKDLYLETFQKEGVVTMAYVRALEAADYKSLSVSVGHKLKMQSSLRHTNMV